MKRPWPATNWIRGCSWNWTRSTNRPTSLPDRRLAALEKNHAIVAKRQDSFLRKIMVLVLVGKYDQAIEYLTNNYFHAREGSEEIHDVYVDAHLLEGLKRLDEGRPADALQHFQKAAEYPENLSVGRPQNDPRSPQIAYYTGLAHAALQDDAAARLCFARAVEQDVSRSPEALFYQAMAHVKLDQSDTAVKLLDRLLETGQRRLARGDSSDFFAKFGRQETKREQTASAHFILGLGQLGKGQTDKARQELEQAAQMNLSHVWARYHLAALETLRWSARARQFKVFGFARAPKI